MTATVLKRVISELTRVGCQVEQLAHDPAVVTFRAPDGSRMALAGDDIAFRMARLLDGAPGPVAQYGTLHDAIRAACPS